MLEYYAVVSADATEAYLLEQEYVHKVSLVRGIGHTNVYNIKVLWEGNYINVLRIYTILEYTLKCL